MSNEEFQNKVLGFIEGQQSLNAVMFDFVREMRDFKKTQIEINEALMSFVQRQEHWNEDLKMSLKEAHDRITKVDNRLIGFIEDQTEENYRLHTRIDGVRLSLEDKMDDFIEAQMKQNQRVDLKFEAQGDRLKSLELCRN